MTLKRINTDAIGWEEPNPVAGQPPVYRSAKRGDVVDLPEVFVEQNRNTKVLRHYPAPSGETLGVARYESVLVDPDGGGEDAERAKSTAEIARLEAELANLRATAPPSPAGSVAQPNEVFLAPSVTGTRLLGEPEPLTQGVRLQAPQPAPEPAPEPVTVGKGKSSN